jgi:preprotein translocase subunit SecA
MATETKTPANKMDKMELSFWEKLGDSLTSITETVGGFLTRLFGSSNERVIRNWGYSRPKNAVEHVVAPGSLLEKVNVLEEQMQNLSDEELMELTPAYRERLAAGEPLDDLLPEAFAACREAGRRAKNMRHYDVQILGGIALHQGMIAEMVTGEGKTLVATLPAYLNALEAKGVHIVTVNDYLARRDCEWMSPIFHALGISAGFIQSDMDPTARRRAYDCDITYGTNSEFGFDYLRDNMKPARWSDPNYPTEMHQCQKNLNYAIIDEVDNILIDEARTPLIISGPAFGDLRRYARANDIVLQLNELQKREPGKYFEINEKDHSCHLTDDGVRKAEELAGVESFYTAGNMEWPHLIDNALKAHHLYEKDKRYVVMRHPESNEMSIIIVDEFTGRLMVGRQWSDGLHQAVEAKHAREGVKIKEETQTLATITLQNFFKLYKKLAGMTGTAMTEANEFWKIYKLDVIAIPTNQPLVRADFADLIYMTEKEKWTAISDEIERISKWDIVKLTDGTELVGNVKKEEQLDVIKLKEGEELTGTIQEEKEWDILKLKDGTELIGVIKEENAWDVVKMKDGTKLVGVLEEEKEWDYLKLKDGTELVGSVEEEGEEEIAFLVRGEEDQRTIAIDSIEEHQQVTEVEFIEKGSEQSRTLRVDEIEEREEMEEVKFQAKDSEETKTIAVSDVEEHSQKEEYIFKVKGKKEPRTIAAEDVALHSQEAKVEIVVKGTSEKRTLEAHEIDVYEPRGRPILIGTTTVEKSEKLSGLLKRRGIKHELLNAKPEYAAREAEIVAQAGRISAVTISTNMAGRGTDIILGGNAEFLAWSKLKDKYETRLDVPPEEWKDTIAEIEAREKMKEEGRRVAAMGGLHVVGTERHEARRIDNQLRGRSGRQGDPGSTRFFLSLEDDLMRVFAGEWVQGVLRWAGMEEGQSIESPMVSRRIAAAQKKVEERNFDIRKNLLEYDEVMDLQRKSIYSYRQDVLEGKNCKILIAEMLYNQIELAADRFMDEMYGPASFAEYVGNKLSTEFRPTDFMRTHFDQAERFARDRASKVIPTMIHDAMEENLSAEDPKEWNWQAMAHAVNSRWSLKMTERQLKQIGHENVAQYLIEKANQVIEQVDLNEAKKFLDPDWGLKAVSDWARLKFQIKVEPADLKDLSAEEIKGGIFDEVKRLYREKEIEFPVRIALARFMTERKGAPGGKHYDREGLYRYCHERFPGIEKKLSEEDFHTKSRSQLMEGMLEHNRGIMPETSEFDMDDYVQELCGDTDALSEEQAENLVAWMRENLKVELEAEELREKDADGARQMLWNAFDTKYRPEMRRTERSLLLNQLDTTWKNHLYTMDHLRHSIGLVGYAQEDPKTAYKREGMKEFDAMWETVRDKVGDTIFRMEEESAFAESVWAISEVRHDAAAGLPPAPAGSIQAQQQAAIQSSQQQPGTEKKIETIRNRSEKVGRNSPCPCKSGKKYKNCCMRTKA